MKIIVFFNYGKVLFDKNLIRKQEEYSIILIFFSSGGIGK